ncbi:major facilitator superfamily domain-containing protein [Aspergillus pseudonomiae]|uniref:Major facilitator superfamily domain-containing protein n=1 Tax=Aspergillus pseudonomiae TaxID=1506151 RepID=A0A5N7D7D1_9EURO|nr:major facilitator superfamily domain-containing protein [Aspergillus pseudonomiae]KAB8260285.1 major facilitator superfamily domain-containing protein [Aspergillus pseudonomiae]KAE8402321.1 major facilitator superfamily domain-containing protein [Aspergillus pseudonomiae]
MATTNPDIGNALAQQNPPPDKYAQEAKPVFKKTERWNHPRSNILKTAATFWSFLVMGANDAAYGPLIPYLEEYYNLSYTVVSLVFLSPLGGYTLAALLNNKIHTTLGRRGVAWISPGCHLLAYIVNCVHPPYPVLVVSFIFAGFGNGLADSAWNAWIGNMANANELLGLLHGLYGVGAVLSPLVATSLITEAKVPWYYFYYIMIGCAAIELAFCLFVFWDSTAAALREATTQEDGPGGGLREALTKRSARVTWICAFFLLGYVGIEVALGGWIVTFMMRVRHGADFASGMVATGFWLGIACGRVVLGFITPRIGEKMAIIVYSLFAIACGLILWLVPNFYASAVAVSFQGFFLGPFFPAAVIVATKLLPRSLHVSAIGFAAAFGGGGAAVLPFVVGAIAQARGVQVLQPFIIGLSAGILLLWLGLPRLPKKVDEEQHGTSDV